jgi:hypothetical protein
VRGLHDVARRLAAGPAAIAYLGNSVTAQRDGYRPHLHAGLAMRFGQAHRAVNAGFGGVGSIASVCMMDLMVGRHRPALCFIECMTGDMGVGLHPDTGAALEGVLRKLADIDCAACFLNLPRQDADFSKDDPVVSLYGRVAAHHRTPAIDLGPVLHDAGPSFFRDVVHTTAAGGRRTAGLILEQLDGLFATPGMPGPTMPLFGRDYGGAAMVPVGVAHLRDRTAFTAGEFRLAYRHIDIGPDNEIRFHSGTAELLGMLIVAGPHSGPTLIGGEEHQLRDPWCHYERLHAVVFDRPFPAGGEVAISPLNEARAPSLPAPRLQMIGFLVRDA